MPGFTDNFNIYYKTSNICQSESGRSIIGWSLGLIVAYMWFKFSCEFKKIWCGKLVCGCNCPYQVLLTFWKNTSFPFFVSFFIQEISNYCNDSVSNQCKTFNLSFIHSSCTTLFQFGSFTIMFSSVATQVFCCSQILNHVVFDCLYLITLICLSLVIGFPKYRVSWTMKFPCPFR